MFYIKTGSMYLCRVMESARDTYGDYIWARPPTLYPVAELTRETLEKDFCMNPEGTDTDILKHHCRAKHGKLIMGG